MNIIEKYIANNHFGKTLGMDFKIIETGLVHYFLTITQDHLSTPKAVQVIVLLFQAEILFV